MITLLKKLRGGTGALFLISLLCILTAFPNITLAQTPPNSLDVSPASNTTNEKDPNYDQAQIQNDQNAITTWNAKLTSDTAAGNTAAVQLDQAEVREAQADIQYQQAWYQLSTTHGQDISWMIANFLDGNSGEDTDEAQIYSSASQLNAAKALVSQAQGNPAAAAQQKAQAQGLLNTSQNSLSKAANACSLVDMSKWGNCVAIAVATVAFALASFAGWLLGFVGALFNWIVVISVFRFGDYFGNSTGLLTAWGILRDIGNILLLFGFIFMGIIMILDLHTVDTRKAIPQLIIVAVLLNFSLFAAEAVIDVANVLSASLYNQAGIVNQGISALILNDTGLNNIFTTTSGGLAGVASSISDNAINQMVLWLGITMFIVVTLVVLLAAAIMLSIRAIVLLFIMVLSPLGLAAMVIPPLAGLGKQWRDMLISQSFFAPIFLLLLLVSLKIMEAVKISISGSATGTLYDAINQPNANLGGIVIVFVLITGFMIAALMSAKKMGAIGADYATNIATRAVRGTMLRPVKAIGAPVGGFAYRNTAGRAAAGLASLQTKPGLLGATARGLNLATGGSLQRGLGKVQESKFLGTESYKERKALVTETKHSADTARYKGNIQKGVRAGATEEQKNAMRNAFNKLSDADAAQVVKGLSHHDAMTAGAALSTSKFKKLIDNADIGHSKDNLIEGRFQTQRDVLQKHLDDIKKGGAGDIKAVSAAFKDLNEKEFEIMAVSDPTLYDKTFSVTNPATGRSVVKESVIDGLVKNEAINQSQQAKARSVKTTEQLKSIYANKARVPVDPVQVNILVKNTSGKKLAELSNDDLLQPEIARGVNREKLAAIMAKEEGLEPSQREQFLTNLENHFSNFAKGTPEQIEYEDMRSYIKSNKNAKNFWGRDLL